MNEIIHFLLEKGLKGISIFLLSISFMAMFISPSYIFIYLYKNSLFSEDNIYTTIIILVIIDAILFISLLTLSSIIPPYFYNKKNKGFIDKDKLGEKMYYISIVITLGLMSLISIIQLIAYYFKHIYGNKSELSFGIFIFFISFIVISVVLGFIWGRLKRKEVNANKEFKKLYREHKSRS